MGGWKTLPPPDPPEWGGGGISEKFSLTCGGLLFMIGVMFYSAAGDFFLLFLMSEMTFFKGNRWICDLISQKFRLRRCPPPIPGRDFSKLPLHSWGGGGGVKTSPRPSMRMGGDFVSSPPPYGGGGDGNPWSANRIIISYLGACVPWPRGPCQGLPRCFQTM